MLAERIRQMESDIERISGVEQARMRVQEGEISEVHVIADRSRRPKWIARDVITTLFTRHGVRIPHQRISVASADRLAGPKDWHQRPIRKLRISRIVLTIVGNRLHASVEVADGGRSYSGNGEGLMMRGSRNRIIGEAALDALGRLSGGNVGLQLEEAKVIHIGRTRAALVHVLCVRGAESYSFVGCCKVTGSSTSAVARAVLRAVGRALPTTPPDEEEVEYLIEDKEETSG